MKAKVQKWGNSLGVRIPKEIAIKADLDDGTEIELIIKGGVVTLIPKKKIKITLSAIIKSLNDSGPYKGETDWGTIEGREVW